MYILLPTYQPNTSICEIALDLLNRYWPAHPPIHQVRMDSPAWLGPVSEAVGALNDPHFILLLDDYALCAPVQTEQVSRAIQLMAEHPTLSLFPLTWYPASARSRDPNLPTDILRLTGAPVLLQAAVWRRDSFLALAHTIDPRASAWGFEAAATRQLRSLPDFTICAFDHPEPNWIGGPLVDGFDKTHWPVPYHNLLHRGRPAPQHEPFLRAHGLSFPSRGLGDTLSKLADATGISKIVRHIEQVTNHPCGCSSRREWLNDKLPYR